MFTYQKATPEILETLWNDNIKLHKDEKERWMRWKKIYIDENEKNLATTFAICKDGYPIGEGTLLWNKECHAIKERTSLASIGTICNVNALRIQKAYEGQGHISKLMKVMEEYARNLGYQKISIGVEANQTRNLAIYLHFGYQELIHVENEDGELVLYYAKTL